MGVTKRMSIVDDLLQKEKETYSETNEAKRSFATDAYTKMRETWEYAVEEILFAGVAGRFRPDIATLRLRAAHVDKADSNARRKALEKEGQVCEAGSIAADVLNQLSRNAAHHCGIATAGEPGHAGQGPASRVIYGTAMSLCSSDGG